MRVAIVHDWIDGYRGGEKVLEELAAIYPDAPIYTLFFDQESAPDFLKGRDIRFPAGLNAFRKVRKALLPILPLAIEKMDLLEFDLIISSSSCVAKGVIARPDARHICYIHSPMRYIWDQQKHYLGSLVRLPLIGWIVQLLVTTLRIWDTVSAQRVSLFIANSNFVKQRVRAYYGRDAAVVYPPVATEKFAGLSKQIAESPYFLVAGAAVPYKRVDLAIRACEELGKRLVVAGDGDLLRQYRPLARNHTEFVDNPSATAFANLLAGATALLFPGVEDFGIVPIEAMACGTPVIAFSAGGALDYLIPDTNGLFFREQSVESLKSAIAKFDDKSFDAAAVRASVERFGKNSFKSGILAEVSKLLEGC